MAIPVPEAFTNYCDETALNPPAGAETTSINILYQPTGCEYIQSLYLANDRSNSFLADEGINMLDALLNNGMAEPYIMASASWVNTSGCAYPPARIAGVIPSYYSTLQSACDDARDGETLQSQYIVFNVDLFLDLDKTIIFESGYDCDCSVNTGVNSIKR